MSKSAQARAIKKYQTKTYRAVTVLNPDHQDEAKIIDAIKADNMSFSERAKQLLKQYYKID